MRPLLPLDSDDHWCYSVTIWAVTIVCRKELCFILINIEYPVFCASWALETFFESFEQRNE